MKGRIKEGLKKLNGAEWTNFDDARCEYTEYVALYDELTETGVELIATCESVEIATIIAEMPRWLQWQDERIDELERVLKLIANTDFDHYAEYLAKMADGTFAEYLVDIAREAINKMRIL